MATNARSPGGLWVHSDPLLNKSFYPNGLVVVILTWYQSGLGFESRRVVLWGYGRTHPLLNKPFYPNGLVTGILTCYQSEGLRRVHLGGYGRTHPLLNKPFYPNGLVTGILTWC
ncbi:unnamed protein product [Closterium sp. NIES-54]